MSTEKQSLFIPLGGGIDDSFDQKLLPVGKVPAMINCYTSHTGEILKKPGTVSYPNIATGGAALGQTWQLASYKGALVSLQKAGPNPIYMFSPAAQQWARAIDPTLGFPVEDTALRSGLRGPVKTGRIPLVHDANFNQIGDVVPGGGFYFGCYIAGAGVAMRVFDAVTNRLIYTWRTPLGTEFTPRVLIVGANVVLFYQSGTTISAAVWLISAMGTGGGVPTAGAIGGNAVGNLDVITTSATTCDFAYQATANRTISGTFTPSTFTSISALLTTSAAAPIDSTLAVGWQQDFGGSGKKSLITCGAAGLAVQWDVNPTAGTTATTYVMDAGATANVHNVAGHTITNNATGEFNVLYDVVAGTTATTRINNQTKYASRNVGPGIQHQQWLLSCGLSSKTFTYNGDYYALVNFSSTVQGSYFLVRVPIGGNLIGVMPVGVVSPLARIAMWQSGGADGGTAAAHVPYVSLVAAGTFITTIWIDNLPQGTINTAAIDLVSIQFDAQLGPTREASDALYVPGGTPGFFDGLMFEEDGVSVYPESPQLTHTPAASTLAPGTYICVATYEWRDLLGNFHRSTTSVPASVTIAAGDSIGWTVSTLRIGNRPTTIRLWRSEANQIEPLQEVNALVNSTTVDTLAFTDIVGTALHVAGNFVYTTGGVLDAGPAPGFSYLFEANQRLWGVSMDDPTEVWFTDKFQAGEAPRWSESRIVRVADDHGAFFWGAGLDGKIVLAKLDALYAFAGDGPDELGNGGYSDPQMFPGGGGIGGTSVQSIATTKDGIWFLSIANSVSVKMIDRSLSVVDIGSPVRDLDDGLPAIGAMFIPDLDQLRMYFVGETALVYDVTSGLWSQFLYEGPSPTFNHAVAYGGSVAMATSLGAIVQEDTTGLIFSDEGLAVTMQVLSPWVQLAGVRGFSRLHRIQGVGRNVNNHTLTVSLFLDFDLSTPRGGSKSKSFSGIAPWLWELVPTVQRGSAFLVALTETSGGAGPAINGVTFLLGLKPGLGRLAPGRRMGAP